MQLRNYQSTAVEGIRAALKNGSKAPLLVLPTGGGKCLAKGTPILMYNGTIKPVEDVIVGDLLMGPDSQPRRVKTTCVGQELMYKVTPSKGDAYVVNESHILSLKITGTYHTVSCGGRTYCAGDIANVTVRDYVSANKTFKHCAKGWRTGVEFSPSATPLLLDSYFLGIWLGDGSSRNPQITTGDDEILEFVGQYAKQLRCDVRIEYNSPNSVNLFFVDKKKGGRGGSKINNALKYYKVWNNKHVPLAYKTSSRENRLALLAGIIDTDGYYSKKGYDIVLKSERLLDDIIFVARSLGFAAYKSARKKTCANNGAEGVYYSCSISGHIDEIPCKIQRKKANQRKQKKNVLHVGVKVEPVGIDNYYGFEIEGNDRLFLLGDFTVTHNTIVFSHIAANASAKNKRVLVLVHRIELMRQTSEKLQFFGVRHGLINPQYTPDLHAKVQVASVQTLIKRIEKYRPYFQPDLIIVDEAHHGVAGTWRNIIAAYPTAKVLGVTATPVRGDGKGLGIEAGGLFDDIVVGPQVQELIDMGFLVKPKIFAPSIVDLSGVRTKMGDYDKKEIESRVDKPSITGNAVEHYRRICGGTPAVAFCVSIAHAEHVAAEFKAAGYRAHAVDGSMEDGERKRILNGLGDGSVHVVASCDLISEGTDIPAIGCAILLRPTKSTGLYIQQVGRALRPCEGKEYAIILDHVGNVLTHGLPEEVREWSLDGENKKDKKDKQEPSIKLKQCPQCYIVHEPQPDRCCPECSHEYQVKPQRQLEEKTGELKEITKEDAIALQKARAKEVGMAKTFEALLAVERKRGYKAGWARHVWAARNKKIVNI